MRRALLSVVVALIALSAISAPTALAGHESSPAVDAAGSTSPATPASSGQPPVPGEPAPADAGPAEPVGTDPGATHPRPVEPTSTDPGTDPGSTAPTPTGPATDPGPTEPAPTNPGPVDPSLNDPVPTEPAPPEPPPAAEAPTSEPAPAAEPPTSQAETNSSSGPEDETSPSTPDAGAEDGAPLSTPDERSGGQAAPSTPDVGAEGEAALSTPDVGADSRLDESAPDQPPSEGLEIVAIAHNRNVVFQVVWQIQEGCRTHCYGTSQSQSVIQWSSTTQNAAAVAGGQGTSTGGSSPASAEAHNESITVQFIWQLQIGCVAFCYETSQIQSASQSAETIQTAIAEADLEALAENLSETRQYVWQIQEGCTRECYGVYQSQTTVQGQSTTQSATARAAHETPVTMIVLGPDGVVVLPGWLVALAANQGATIQSIYQRQQAVCLEHCQGDVQLQEAIQQALTSQEAIAIAWVGPEEVEQPPLERGPEQQPPVQAAGQQPPMQQGAGQPPIEQPAGQQPVEQPAGQQPEVEQSAVERPAVEQLFVAQLVVGPPVLGQPAAAAAQMVPIASSVSALARLLHRPSAHATRPERAGAPSRLARRSRSRDESREDASPLTAPAVPPGGGGQLPHARGTSSTDTAFLPIASFPSPDDPSPATPAAHDVETVAPFERDLTLEVMTADDSDKFLVLALVITALALFAALAALGPPRANSRVGAR